ncbi:MAG: response regulator [Gemmatimonadales bacterium]|nr:response regulator [Gemmatimonadota bacterium]MBP6668018.1 response regulator [Gemmatimonadales bacterium]MBP9200915.1 response regulator [Gemmatimonadales bacterium]
MSDERRPSIQLKYQLAGTGTQAPAGNTVLVVDDDADMTRLIGAMLATRGLTAVSAYDAIQGFLVAQRQHPKFILVDWHMPAGGGPQLLRKLKDNPATHGIPVVVVTADGSPAIPEEAMALGARGVLHKPIDTDHFVEVVKSLVE